MTRPLRIAMLTHSTNPRGGVVHALELCQALTRLGHTVVLHAPDPSGRGFFRKTRYRTVSVAAGPARLPMAAMVEQRIADYVAHFERPGARDFDLFHAHDGISGNALATLQQAGLIGGFVRSVHHIDDFAEPRLAALQDRSITAASTWASVGDDGAHELKARYGLDATVVGNGVDPGRYNANCDDTDLALRACLGLGDEPVFLVIGGVEARKNTTRILQAFVEARAAVPNARLVIAGGASLLDHSGYRATFNDVLSTSGLPPQSVLLTGPIADADMPALYRLATTLVFASVKEGFGLCVIEAMASGVPVVASSIAPFTDYLRPGEAIWCDPLQPCKIADAMVASLQPGLRATLVPRGHRAAARHDWRGVATRHLPLYQSLFSTSRPEPAHA